MKGLIFKGSRTILESHFNGYSVICYATVTETVAFSSEKQKHIVILKKRSARHCTSTSEWQSHPVGCGRFTDRTE